MSADQTGAAQVTVKAEPTAIFGAEDEPLTRNVRNPSGGKAVTLSRDSGATSGSGWTLLPGAEQRVALVAGEKLWGVCAAATETTLEVI